MKLHVDQRRSLSPSFSGRTLECELQHSGSCSAFTMVEIAIALAVIGFALVAIIGVLPAGLTVQKENREETIINQDATVFIEAIRDGAHGLNDLTNYLMVITNYVQRYDVNTNALGPQIENWYRFDTASIAGVITPSLRLANGARIVGLLSTPKYVLLNPDGDFNSNHIVAYFRAMSGSAVEKYPQKNLSILDLAFSYRFSPELSPLPIVENDPAYIKTYETNLHELRLAFRWLATTNGLLGNGQHTFRTLAGGRVTVTDFNEQPITNFNNGRNLFFIENSTFTMVP